MASGMVAPPKKTTAPPPSAIQKLIAAHPAPPGPPEASHVHHLALQIAHNLRYQHLWTDIRIYYASPVSTKALPRPIISGMPPQRLYIHPDEQIALLQRQKDVGKTGMPELASEREWVLPSHLREKWSLKRFGEAFDEITMAPGMEGGEKLFEETSEGANGAETETNEWRTTKRILLATLDDDSTAVYYVIHDGIVKPRQN